jgi:hypothetical protein
VTNEPNRMRVGRQAGEKWVSVRVDSRSQVGPMSRGNGRTAIAIPASHRLYFTTPGAVIVHRLPHTTGMRRRSRNRQSHRDKRAREQQHKQQSGGQTIHDRYGTDSLATKDRGHKAGAQVFPGYGSSVIPSAGSSRAGRGESKSSKPLHLPRTYQVIEVLRLREPFRERNVSPRSG